MAGPESVTVTPGTRALVLSDTVPLTAPVVEVIVCAATGEIAPVKKHRVIPVIKDSTKAIGRNRAGTAPIITPSDCGATPACVKFLRGALCANRRQLPARSHDAVASPVLRDRFP